MKQNKYINIINVENNPSGRGGALIDSKLYCVQYDNLSKLEEWIKVKIRKSYGYHENPPTLERVIENEGIGLVQEEYYQILQEWIEEEDDKIKELFTEGVLNLESIIIELCEVEKIEI